MAQTRRRRRRKHRGTQAGTLDRRGGASRPRSRQEARARARRQIGDRRELPPTWRSAVGRGLFGAAIFLVLLMLAFGRPAGESFALALFMLAVYIPMGFYMDRFFYNRRQAKRRREREQARG